MMCRWLRIPAVCTDGIREAFGIEGIIARRFERIIDDKTVRSFMYWPGLGFSKALFYVSGNGLYMVYQVYTFTR